jgi:hypothetical protein
VAGRSTPLHQISTARTVRCQVNGPACRRRSLLRNRRRQPHGSARFLTTPALLVITRGSASRRGLVPGQHLLIQQTDNHLLGPTDHAPSGVEAHTLKEAPIRAPQAMPQSVLRGTSHPGGGCASSRTGSGFDLSAHRWTRERSGVMHGSTRLKMAPPTGGKSAEPSTVPQPTAEGCVTPLNLDHFRPPHLRQLGYVQPNNRKAAEHDASIGRS